MAIIYRFEGSDDRRLIRDHLPAGRFLSAEALLRLVLRRRQVFAAPCRRPPGRVLPGLRDINRGRRGRTSFTRPTHDSDEGAHRTSGHAVKHDDAAQQREGHPVGGVR